MTPVLPELPLPLPLPLPVLKGALVAAFLLHIVFVNLMVGGTLVALASHWRGRQDPVFLKLASQLLSTVTVHKSLAVVLGVGPLLLISLAYTVPFYTSSTLVAPAWLSVLWLVTLAFALLYAYKFGWDGWRVRRPRWHAASGVGAAACFLVVPLIYLANTQLMLDRAAWVRQPDFFTAMFQVGNVFPRYAHFMLASLALTGFWIALWWNRPSLTLEDEGRARIVRWGTLWALVPTALQFIAGPVVLFTLPAGAITPLMIAVLAVGILAGAASLFTMADSLRGPSRMKQAALLLLVTIVCMGTARHLIREALLAREPHAALSGASVGAIVNVTKFEARRATYGHESDSSGAAAAHGGRDPVGRGRGGARSSRAA